MFPKLKTGAAIQYPAKRALQFNTDTIRFLDGAEQRFRDASSMLHEWTIQLDLLDEEELAALDQFFVSNQGRYGSFSFTDPWDGTVYPNCSLKADNFAFQLSGEMRGKATVVVCENRS
jgi:phage-related protein